MLKNWARYSAIARIVGVVIILGVLGVVGYQLYDFYRDKVGFTPVRAIETYFVSLAQGNYEEVYRLTYKGDLVDIYGRPITEGEFIDQLRKVTGDRRLPFRLIETTQLLEKQGVRYYRVTLHSSVGGSPGKSELVVQIRREGATWVISYPFAIIL